MTCLILTSPEICKNDCPRAPALVLFVDFFFLKESYNRFCAFSCKQVRQKYSLVAFDLALCEDRSYKLMTDRHTSAKTIDGLDCVKFMVAPNSGES